MSEAEYPANYVTEAKKDTLIPNYYITIDGIGTSFSKYPVTGFVGTIISGLLSAPRFSGIDLQVDTPKTPLQSVAFELTDVDGQVTTIFSGEALHEKQVSLYASPDKDADVADYGLKAVYRLKELEDKDGIAYTVKCVETGELLLERLKIGETTLSNDIDASQTTGIFIENADELGNFPGGLFIGEELMAYTSIDTGNNELLGVSRGSSGTPTDSHSAGDEVHRRERITNTNPIDMILQLIISPGGGGTYDVLSYGMGIDESLVDIPTFESIRDDHSFLQNEAYDLEFRGNEDPFITFIEKHILEPTVTRLWYRDTGKISLMILADPLPVVVPTIVKADMVNGKIPKWRSHSRRIKNQLIVRTNWNAAKDLYEREWIFTEGNSIAAYGAKKPKEIESRMLQSANGAGTFLSSFQNRYFSFYSTPAPELDKTVLKPERQFDDPGDLVTISHPNLPNLASGTRGVFGDGVQIIGKKFDGKSMQSRYKLFYALLLNFRQGFIAPTGYVSNAVQTTTVIQLNTGDGAKFKVDDVVHLWNDNWQSPPIDFGQSVITDVTADQITVSPAFATIPEEDYRIRYADYDVVQDSQRAFAFVGAPGGGDFLDGTKPYAVGP